MIAVLHCNILVLIVIPYSGRPFRVNRHRRHPSGSVSGRADSLEIMDERLFSSFSPSSPVRQFARKGAARAGRLRRRGRGDGRDRERGADRARQERGAAVFQHPLRARLSRQESADPTLPAGDQVPRLRSGLSVDRRASEDRLAAPDRARRAVGRDRQPGAHRRSRHRLCGAHSQSADRLCRHPGGPAAARRRDIERTRDDVANAGRAGERHSRRLGPPSHHAGDPDQRRGGAKGNRRRRRPGFLPRRGAMSDGRDRRGRADRPRRHRPGRGGPMPALQVAADPRARPSRQPPQRRRRLPGTVPATKRPPRPRLPPKPQPWRRRAKPPRSRRRPRPRRWSA